MQSTYTDNIDVSMLISRARENFIKENGRLLDEDEIIKLVDEARKSTLKDDHTYNEN